VAAETTLVLPKSGSLEPKDPRKTEAPTWQGKVGEPWLIGWSHDLLKLVNTPRGVRVLHAGQGETKELLVVLDDARPRSLGVEGRLLGELRVEGEEPAPGPHSLVGCAIIERKLSCQEITFHLDARQGLVSSEPGSTGRCILLEPGGTYFGTASVPLLLIRAPSSSPSSETNQETRVEIARWGGPPGPWLAELSRRDELIFEPGDYTLSLTCGAGESPIERVITVNAGAAPR